jgi:excisionase family DNA binding protein
MDNSTLQLFPMATAARRFSVCRSTLYALVSEGKIATVRIGRRRLVAASELERFIAEHTEAVSGGTAAA